MDIRIENHGTICLLRPLTEAVEEWIDEHVDVPDWSRLGKAVAVEPRYVPPIIEGLQADGFVVEVVR